MARTGARRHWWVWAAVLPIALWALVRTLGIEQGFPLTPLMAYTPYAAVLALLVGGVAVALRNWAAAATAALAAACLLAAVLPRAFGEGSPISAGAAELDVLSANIHHGTARPAALMALIARHDPDLISIQELTPRFARELEQVGIGGAFPHAVLSLRPGVSGAGIYSSLPLRRLAEEAPYGFRMPRAEVLLGAGRSLRVVNVHPLTPKRNQIDRWRDGLRSLPPTGAGTPWLLIGDFNATLDHAELREVIERGYRDAGDATGEGLVPTWPKERIMLPPVTIDHVLADERLTIAGFAVEDLPGSDHRVLVARLGVPRGL